MARKDSGGLSAGRVNSAKESQRSKASASMKKAGVTNSRTPYGRTGSAANQKKMVENAANGTSWATGRKVGLPKNEAEAKAIKRAVEKHKKFR